MLAIDDSKASGLLSTMRQETSAWACAACVVGVWFCRKVVSSARRDGIYRGGRRNPFDLVQADDPEGFESLMAFWIWLGRIFAAGAVLLAVTWTLLVVQI